MRKALLFTALSLPLALAGCTHRTVFYAAPPPAFSQISQRGFHDGLEAARHDINSGLAPDADRHPRFRNPPVPPPAFGDYRDGFREGYRRTFHRGPGGY